MVYSLTRMPQGLASRTNHWPRPTPDSGSYSRAINVLLWLLAGGLGNVLTRLNRELAFRSANA
jgi:hypothetical protein